jgi:heptosyltransferase I
VTESSAVPPSPVRRVGILLLSAVGDVVHALAVVNALKRHDPHTHITWIVQPGPAALVRGHPAVDDIILFDRARGWRAFLDVPRALTQPFDLVLDLQVYFKAGLLCALLRSPVKLGFDRARAHDLNWVFTNRRIPPHALQHVQDQYFEFLDALRIPHEPVSWGLGPWPPERAWQREFMTQFDRPIVPLVIGTSKPQKDWIPARWAELADALSADFGLQPVLVGARSPRELEVEREILERARVPVTSALGSGLRKLVGILDAAALVVSLDTGPLHMAVALDRPVVSLIGYSNPKRVGPYRRFHDLVVDAYGDPGEAYPISMENRLGRMPRIQVRDVLERVAWWRARYATLSPRKS